MFQDSTIYLLFVQFYDKFFYKPTLGGFFARRSKFIQYNFKQILY